MVRNRFAGLLMVTIAALVMPCAAATTTGSLPNILWITCEDMSPNLAAYGDPTAPTPNLDRLAREGMVFNNAFASSPVCSTSRSSIITGLYASSFGAHNHRSHTTLPDGVRCFTAYLRDAGYYCTNNVKTDYNFPMPDDAWDVNSRKAHWRNRPDSAQPFFSVFNFTMTHESLFMAEEFEKRIPNVVKGDRTSTAAVELPPYLPDTPTTRRALANYYDTIMELDFRVGDLLAALEEDGLATNTLVLFFSDHGSGLPRGKRWLYDSGIQVPLIARWPGRIDGESRRDDLVSLLDLAPTMLAVAGIAPRDYMHGRVILGDTPGPELRYLFQTRDRMDETHDMQRSLRDHRFKYIRNFYPERPYDQVVRYAERNPVMRELRQMNGRGELAGAQLWFFQQAKPAEELYDMDADPWEINNLAGNADYDSTLKEMRTALNDWRKETGDRGLEPESPEQVR